MRIVSQKVYGVIFNLIICLIMSSFMSFFMILINVGFTKDFLIAWLGSTGIGLIISFPIVTISMPLIQKILQKYLVIKD